MVQKKQERESAKNTVKTSANGQRQKTSLEETVVPAPPRPPPRAALSRSRKHCKKQYKMHNQQCVCAWTPRRREQQRHNEQLIWSDLAGYTTTRTNKSRSANTVNPGERQLIKKTQEKTVVSEFLHQKIKSASFYVIICVQYIYIYMINNCIYEYTLDI